mgnify:CR=1 FL=1
MGFGDRLFPLLGQTVNVVAGSDLPSIDQRLRVPADGVVAVVHKVAQTRAWLDTS